MSRDRFQACKAAHEILRSRVSQEEERDRLHRKIERNCNSNSCNDCASSADCAEAGCEALNCLGEADCSALDCSSFDAGCCSN